MASEKNSAVSEERHVLTAYCFYLVLSLASMQIKGLKLFYDQTFFETWHNQHS